MSHQGNVGMEDACFASSTMLIARHASMPRGGIDFLLLSSGGECCEALLVPIGQDDPINTVADLASLFDRFLCHAGVVPLLRMILLAFPLLFTWLRSWFAYGTAP